MRTCVLSIASTTPLADTDHRVGKSFQCTRISDGYSKRLTREIDVSTVFYNNMRETEDGSYYSTDTNIYTDTPKSTCTYINILYRLIIVYYTLLYTYYIVILRVRRPRVRT